MAALRPPVPHRIGPFAPHYIVAVDRCQLMAIVIHGKGSPAVREVQPRAPRAWPNLSLSVRASTTSQQRPWRRPQSSLTPPGALLPQQQASLSQLQLQQMHQRQLSPCTRVLHMPRKAPHYQMPYLQAVVERQHQCEFPDSPHSCRGIPMETSLTMSFLA